MTLRIMLLTGVALTLAPAQAYAREPARKPVATASTASDQAALAKMVRDFQIPFQSFTLPNGLKVIVLTDHGSPMVYTSITYNVGSVFEPAGRSGFAHLFEHLMFNGSENVPGDYFAHLRDAGLISANGGTGNDYTNYYEAVPTGSLDRVLFMESDRMGHLLGAVTQAVLDEQRGVVQNEKRNGDNGATSIVGYSRRAAIYPASHPYGHSVIGSMKDLNSASLADVHQWFKDYYGPNNATLLLAGDIDLATAKAKVQKYFGDIPRGRENSFPVSPIPVLTAPIEQTLTGPVTNTIIYRTWSVPGVRDPQNYALDAVSSLMGGINGAPLYEKLVRQDKLFDQLSVSNATHKGIGEFSIAGPVHKGVDPEVAAKALDAAIARFLATPPSAEALDRWKSTRVIPTIRNNEMVEGRGGLLLQADTMLGGPEHYKDDLEAYLKLTPAQVKAAANTWLGRPGYRAMLKPGPRMTPPGDESVAGQEVPDAPKAAVVPPKSGTRGPIPPVGAPDAPRMPVIQEAKLANGIPLLYAHHDAIPFTTINLTFDVGTVDDPADKTGEISWMFQMLTEGAGGHDDHWFRQQSERTGTRIGASAGTTESTMYVAAPSVSLEPALKSAMLMLTRPDFPQDRLEQIRRMRMAFVTSAPENPGALITQAFAQAEAPGSLLARNSTIPTAKEINALTRADLQAAFRRWVRPDEVKMIVVSNEPLATLLPKLNATIGSWSAAGRGPAPKALKVQPALVTGPAKIVLIDMPGQVQAAVMGGQLVDLPPSDEALAPRIANLALGQGFMSRINMNLREDKHWSYGASGGFEPDYRGSKYAAETQVQPDKVGPAIREIQKELNDILTDKPITAKEFDDGVANILRQSASSIRTGGAIASLMSNIQLYDRPLNYYDNYMQRLQALTLDDAEAALRKHLQPSKWVWAITGDAKTIRPQLDGLGLPVEVVTPAQLLANR
ncbi:M16 family metallopeptidase [Sphingomonas sp. Leaf21]|uniref:M16 family metallopeptidase n=1 Tax=Sphingomonas sp. Leaf21 TaxID=2876550 RepID=UPI001E345B9D|nr:pitrilysin family protein [Sphingomonas sp. Leaf21]